MPPPDRHREENRRFWSERGDGARGAHPAVTMLSEHDRYVEYVHRRELAYLERLVDDVGGRPRIHDVGCGAGRLALALAPRAGEIVGTDLSPTLIDVARREAAARALGNVRLEVRGVEETADDLGRFDLVLCSGVLNCVDDDAASAAIRAAATSLAPGGRLYLRNVCAVREEHYREPSADRPPMFYRTGARYAGLVAGAGLAVLDDAFLFPPFCAPNLVYHHALPRGLRDLAWIGRGLDAWFRFESRTADARLELLGPAYPRLLRWSRKPTAFRILVASR